MDMINQAEAKEVDSLSLSLFSMYGRKPDQITLE
jgi:hypothetical protein